MGSAIIERARDAGRTLLTEVESKDALAEAGIAVTRAELANDARDAVAIANRLGYPVVLKVVSDTVAHKSDVGGVVLNVGDAAAVEAAYVSLVANVRAAVADGVTGVSVQPMARPGTEIIVGVSRDPQFGPALMFGLGGVMVEVLGDVSFRIVPLSLRDAREMLHEIRGFRVLEGYRGHPPADLRALENLLLQVSRFIEENPSIQELDLNPVFAYAEGAVAVDARIVVGAELTDLNTEAR
jgi:acetate---CoA ligase (ADP-forming) subunit beta